MKHLPIRILILCLALAAGALSAERPNIIIFLADDLGQECLGCYGGTSIKTPHLDRMAAQGMRFTHGYAQPLCSPSRVQLMTGLYNFHNYQTFGKLPAGERTFGNLLQDAGYATCMVGKWQLSGDLESPHRFGFANYSLWQLDSGQTPRYWNPTKFVADGQDLAIPAGAYGPDLHQAYVKDFIDHHLDRPFCLYYANMLPHEPHDPTPLSADRQSHDDARNFVDMVQYVDHQLGEILDHLAERKIDRNTIVIFTGDNGTNARIVSRQAGHDVKGGKGQANERGTHVPLIAWWPGTVKPGVSDALVDFTDILPTVAEAAQVKIPTTCEGHSFLPQAKGLPGEPRTAVYGWYYGADMGFASSVWAQDGHWWLTAAGKLYDLDSDPDMTKPVTDGAAAQAARTRLQAVIDGYKAAPPAK